MEMLNRTRVGGCTIKRKEGDVVSEVREESDRNRGTTGFGG
ncbi:MAG: hypothetical protein QM496_18925 [Verrucomicrobiota bacterium]